MAAIAIEGIHDGLGEIEVTVELVPGDFRMMFALSPHEGGHVDLFLSLEETARHRHLCGDGDRTCHQRSWGGTWQRMDHGAGGELIERHRELLRGRMMALRARFHGASSA